jgi:hypothetical protein
VPIGLLDAYICMYTQLLDECLFECVHVAECVHSWLVHVCMTVCVHPHDWMDVNASVSVCTDVCICNCKDG